MKKKPSYYVSLSRKRWITAFRAAARHIHRERHIGFDAAYFAQAIAFRPPEVAAPRWRGHDMATDASEQGFRFCRYGVVSLAYRQHALRRSALLHALAARYYFPPPDVTAYARCCHDARCAMIILPRDFYAMPPSAIEARPGFSFSAQHEDGIRMISATALRHLLAGQRAPQRRDRRS